MLTLLYRLAEWHALAKLRMHTDLTLNVMESVTVALGRELRKFRDVTCAAYVTVELRKEMEARKRRRKRVPIAATVTRNPAPTDANTPSLPICSNSTPPSNQKHLISTAANPTPSETSTPSVAPAKRRQKKLNLSTYKLHALADYVHTIRLFGTTDSYSTQTVQFLVLFSANRHLTKLGCRESWSIDARKGCMERQTKTRPFDR